jgi:cytochrome c biogenesis protein CcmG/thiol:disulfide interchange protein DsbE
MSEHDPPELDSRPQSRREWNGWLRSLVLPLGLVVAIVAGLLYLQSNRTDGTQEDGFGSVALPAERNPTGQPVSATEGRAAPDFLLRDLDGRSVRLSDLQGRPLMVNFWASWCGPCREETPELIDLYESRRSEGLVMLGVNLREATGPTRDFVQEFGISYPVLLDLDGQVAGTWRIGGPNQGVPSTYFIDATGVVQKVVFGPLTDDTIADGLALILPEAG